MEQFIKSDKIQNIKWHSDLCYGSTANGFYTCSVKEQVLELFDKDLISYEKFSLDRDFSSIFLFSR